MNNEQDKQKGILTEQRFVMITKHLEQEQSQGKKCMQEITVELNLADDLSKDIRIFIDDIGQSQLLRDLTR